MSPPDNAVSVDRKEAKDEKEKGRVNEHCFANCISEGSMMKMQVKW